MVSYQRVNIALSVLGCLGDQREIGAPEHTDHERRAYNAALELLTNVITAEEDLPPPDPPAGVPAKPIPPYAPFAVVAGFPPG